MNLAAAAPTTATPITPRDFVPAASALRDAALTAGVTTTVYKTHGMTSDVLREQAGIVDEFLNGILEPTKVDSSAVAPRETVEGAAALARDGVHHLREAADWLDKPGMMTKYNAAMEATVAQTLLGEAFTRVAKIADPTGEIDWC